MPPNSASLDNAMRVSLTRGAGIFAGRARAIAESKNLPQETGDAISVGPYQSNGTTYRISVIVDLRVAPAAGAFEYGSGIHSTRGPKQTYPIFPKNKMMLVFKWPKVDGEPGFNRTKDGKVVLAEVNHPGVEAKPFMRPALEEVRGELRSIIGQQFRVQVLGRITEEI